MKNILIFNIVAQRIWFLFFIFLFSVNAYAADRTGKMKTRNNAELPKVLYIIPWKQAPVGDLVGKPVESLLDEALSSIDRNIFLREVSYYESLRDYDRNNRLKDIKSNEKTVKQE